MDTRDLLQFGLSSTLLSLLDRLLVRLGTLTVSLTKASKYFMKRTTTVLGGTYPISASKQPTRLPRPLQLPHWLLPQQMNLGNLTLENILDRHDTLHEQRLRIPEIQVHHTHHPNPHKRSLDPTLDLRRIVILHRRRNKRRLLL
jgi:hypothetical protein